MILVNNLDKMFKNTSIIYVDCEVKIVEKIEQNDLVFFVDQNKNIHSINVLDNAKYQIKNDKKFYSEKVENLTELLNVVQCLNLNLNVKKMFVYGEILDRQNHPSSDKLFVLSVKIADNTNVQIVTNTLDSQIGKTLVVGLPGATTFAGLEILPNQLLNVDSYGMLCGYQTLGINKEGLIFSDNNKVGEEFVI
ncbi:TyrS-associated PheT N-terminal domain-related protein TapR [Mycoplasma leonicaptivi]|uniref:TyrS-associated PheT N-terminal domain-related protein TapR n=1 Tax=Mycoplasma leonicaptivi TaxID=36742 RepID=UPI000481B635|nr:hypothetical protein [Mycoplasma leonicaptivi]